MILNKHEDDDDDSLSTSSSSCEKSLNTGRLYIDQETLPSTSSQVTSRLGQHGDLAAECIPRTWPQKRRLQAVIKRKNEQTARGGCRRRLAIAVDEALKQKGALCEVRNSDGSETSESR